jgi:hypothetical protein
LLDEIRPRSIEQNGGKGVCHMAMAKGYSDGKVIRLIDPPAVME